MYTVAINKNEIVDSTISNYIDNNKIDLLCVNWNFTEQTLAQKIITKTQFKKV